MLKHLIILFAMAASAAFAAGIPQEWAVDVARVKPHQIQAYHGDTMELKATYWLNGAPFDVGAESFRLYWQTNAMEEIYWSADATAASNTVSATFANTMDPGAPIVYGFLGSTGGNYRASFAIRFSPGPGAVPNALPLPQPTIDFDKVEVLNPPWQTPDYSPSNAELVATIEAVAPPADLTPATNYTDSVASELAGSIAVAASSATNYTDAARDSLSTSLAVAAQSATNYTDSSAYDLRLEIAEASFAAKGYTDSVAASKADLNTYTTPEFTTNDLWLCEWSGEVLPLRTATPWPLWQKAYNATPALMYIRQQTVWQLNTQGSTLLTVVTNATAAVLDFGSGYTLKRLTGPAHVVYRDELDRAIAAAEPGNYEGLSNKPQINGHTLTNNLTGASLGLLGNSGNQNLNGQLSFWNGNLAFIFEDAVLNPVISLWGGVLRIAFPAQSGTLARLEDMPSVSGLAPLASPAFTGTPTAPTPTAGDDSTKVATTAFVQGAVAGISVTPLSGQTFDFATTQGVMDALKTVIEALGGSVTNAPSTTISQGE